MENARRSRACPTQKQQARLMPWNGCQRFIYTAKVGEDPYFRALKCRFPEPCGAAVPLDQPYAPFIGSDTAWRREVPWPVLRNAAVRWQQANSRFFKKVAGLPTIEQKGGRESLWSIAELFSIIRRAGGRWLIPIGTPHCPAGEFEFIAHRETTPLPRSVTGSVEAGRWFVLFTTDDGEEMAARDDIGERWEKRDEAALRKTTVRIDRNTPAGKHMAGSHRKAYTFSATQCRGMEKAQTRIRRCQKSLPGDKKGSCNGRKTKRRIAHPHPHAYLANVRKDFAPKSRHDAVTDPQAQVFAFENRRIQNRVRRPTPRQDTKGRRAHNGARAKARLNQAILTSAWGLFRTLGRYKALRPGTLELGVEPADGSQAGSARAHTHPDDRPSQAGFVCHHCGFGANADDNATIAIRSRGVTRIRDGRRRETAPRKTMRLRREKVGREAPRPEQILLETLAEDQDKSPVPEGAGAPAARRADSGNRHYNAEGV